MHLSHVFRTIETHTGGNPTRTVLSGIPPIHGATMMDKVDYFRTHYDGIRTSLMFEPRGHGVMSGCILTEPVHPEADLGVIFIEVGGYLPMCGHDTIGLITALLETGQFPMREPVTPIVLDTPSGVVRTEARVHQGRVVEVSFVNVPAFLYRSQVKVTLDAIGCFPVDIAWGGNFYGVVKAGDVGLSLRPTSAKLAIGLAKKIRQAVNRELDIVHPAWPQVRGLTHIEFFGAPTPGWADIKNMVVVPPGGIDRSPCGTGTSAKAAILWSQGQLGVGESFVHESVTGARFTATIVEPTRVGAYDAVTVKISGQASIYGESTFVIDPRDPVSAGFLLS